MEWIILLLLVLLVGCSDIPKEERTEYCESLGFDHDQVYAGGWWCGINDESYLEFINKTETN